MNNRINVLRFSLISRSCHYIVDKEKMRRQLKRQEQLQNQQQTDQADQEDQAERPPLQSIEMFQHMIAQGYAPASMMWVATDVTEGELVEGMRVAEKIWSGALIDASESPTPQALWILKQAGHSLGGTQFIEVAAEFGRLYNLAFLLQNGATVTAIAVEKAAVNGHRSCLKLLLQFFAAEVPPTVVTRTVSAGRAECLECLLDFNVQVPMEEVLCVASKGSEKCLRLLIQRANYVPSEAVAIAAAGHVGCLKLLLAQKPLMISKAFVPAVEHSDACLKLLLEHAKKYDLIIPEEAVTAAAAGYYESLSLLLEYQVQINQSALNAAACHFSCLGILLRRGLKATRETVIGAAAGFYSCLELLLKDADQNCISGEAATAAAAFYPCLQLLIERGAPISEQTVVAAAGHFDCLSLVLQKTKVLSTEALREALKRALTADSYDCVHTILTFAQSEFCTEAVRVLVQWCRSMRTLTSTWNLLKKLNGKIAWPNSTCKTLIKRDREDMLVFAVDKGAKCTTSSLEKAVQTGNLSCYMSLYTRVQRPLGKIECELAVAGGEIEILKHMHRVMKAPWGETLTRAAERGFNHFLQYAFNNGNMPANETAWVDLAEAAACNGHLHTLEFLAGYGCDIKADRVLFAAAGASQFALCVTLIQSRALKDENLFIAHLGGLVAKRLKGFNLHNCAKLLGAIDEDGYIITWAIKKNKKGCFIFAASQVPQKKAHIPYWVQLMKVKKRKGWINELPKDNTLFLGYKY